MWLLKEHETFIFKHPFRCYIAGPSFSGKTTLIQKILQSTKIDQQAYRKNRFLLQNNATWV
jgi:uridine kinase